MTKEFDKDIVNEAVKTGGSYDIIKSRLFDTGKNLSSKTEALNNLRKNEFGGSKNEILTKIKVRTENNCIPVDMEQVNDLLLVGYQVSLGLKQAFEVADLFDLYQIKNDNDNFTLDEISLKNTFLDDPLFVKSFDELMKYYKGNQLVQISNKNDFLYITFQIGSLHTDRKVYKFQIKKDSVVYVNDKANEEILNNNNHCFKWIETKREDHRLGKNPHISVLDKVFVETVGGDLTIKVEDNTEDGLGIYNEPVKDQKQVIEDASIFYAEVNELIVLKIKPSNEDFRYFIFNTVTKTVIRADSINNSCQELPEKHGLVFPEGYFLSNGEFKIFEKESKDLTHSKTVASPNGEDYLYIFFDPIQKSYVLYSYNLINKKIENPIHAHGYTIMQNGNIPIFRNSENSEPSKIHPLTIWKTPYYSDLFFNEVEKKRNLEERNKELLNIGNADLVSAISDLYTVINFIKKDEVSTSLFEGIIRTSQLLIDNYHWLSNENFLDIKKILLNVIDISELVIEEFVKVKEIQNNAIEILNETLDKHEKLISKIKLTSPTKASDYVIVLSEINSHIGHLITIKGQRYIDLNSVELMYNKILEEKTNVNERLLKLLQDKKSFEIYLKEIEKVEDSIEEVKKVFDIEPLEKTMLDINSKISLINSEINEIEAKDSTVTSTILNYVSEVFSRVNQVNAKIKQAKKGFLSKEAKLEFAAQFKLLTQSVSNGLSRATSPDKADEELSSLIGLIEKLESKFSDFDEYTADISQKRNEINDAFENHKQQLINAIQKRITSIVKAGEININSITKKVEKFNSIDDLNTYFSSDVIVLKVRSLVEKIKDIGGVIQAEDLESKLVKIKDMSMRSLRDNQDIFEDGGKIMKMGKHRFPVNKTPLDLTILNKDGEMQAHLTSTDYFNKIESDQFKALEHLWNADLASESVTVYRSEYLAYLLLNDALRNLKGLSFSDLVVAKKDNKLLNIITEYSDSLYKDNYIKGVHDYDANIILSCILDMYSNAGTLTYSQYSRSIALVYFTKNNLEDFSSSYANAKKMKYNLNNPSLWDSYINEISFKMKELYKDVDMSILKSSAEFYLEFCIDKTFEYSKEAEEVNVIFKNYINSESLKIEYNDNELEYYDILCLWIESILRNKGKEELCFYIKDAASLYFIENCSKNKEIITKERDVKLSYDIKGLIGDHNTIIDGEKTITLDDFITRVQYHKDVYYPSFEAFLKLRQDISKEEKEKLFLEDFKSKPLTSFVRNKLISDIYLPMIGDNFAKQMGTVGESKRSDLMGLLLLISPPGYGKTTLIEYVANKLGLVFVKINCPSIGHSITSLDPNEARDSTSKKEINKINLAFEMGSNVLLYLDDIQHTNSEFLQKFISLCDGTRRIEGVWDGKTKTYDMRGKKFCVVMAGNPYTETGESFKIPDMLANRADIYNLGDILGGKIDTFKLSYIENSLTSNSVLSPLATRDMNDVYKFIKMAQGEKIAIDELEHNYSPAEANEIKNVMSHMLKIQDVVFLVNKEYIKSAATEDNYRVEPIFKLQGSYRNMNKMTEKLVSVMNDKELSNLIIDHYTGESQTLTGGAESNMLKLKSLMNIQSDVEKERWNMICSEFNRNRKMGGDESDSGKMIANQLSFMTDLMEKNYIISAENSNSNTLQQESFENIKILLESSNSSNQDVLDSISHLAKGIANVKGDSASEYIDSLKMLVTLIKENQSEDKLIDLFSKRIEELNNNFIVSIERKDEQQMKIFSPMIKYFETILKKHNSK